MISGKDLEGWITAPDPLAAMEKAQNQAYYRDRRERIATAALAGLLTHYGETSQYDNAADCSAAAVAYADALIAELDKEVKP